MMTSRMLRNLGLRVLLVSAVLLAGCSKTVPNVVGQTQDGAVAAVVDAGFVLGAVTPEYSATVAAGTVLAQSPAGGAGAESRSAVALTVSQGPQPLSVPNVAGLTQAAARAAIIGAGLTPGTVTQAYSATVAPGRVIGQVPEPGASALPGDAVALTLSEGVPPGVVPNVVGETQDAAVAAITDAGLTVGAVTPVYSATVPSGSVISQDPVAGTGVARGTAVLLTLSEGPAPVAVPNVVNMPQATASAVIAAAGLAVGAMTPVYSATVAAGWVISQNPAGGSAVPAGTQVALTVSQGPQPVAVPDVTGMAQEAARAVITTSGLSVGTVTLEYSDTVVSGEVLMQHPAGGSLALPGDAVALVVSEGPQPVTVPNVLGMKQTAADAVITGALLALGAVAQVYSTTVAPGCVISQDPIGGSTALPGTAVALTVSDGLPPIDVPDVVGLAQAEAFVAITDAGLAVGTVTLAYSPTVAAGLVISQAPPGGSTVISGSAVALVISQGPQPVKVPQLVGLSEDGTLSVLLSASLSAGPAKLVYSATAGPGYIISQNPVGGASVLPGTTVALIVSRGLEPDPSQSFVQFGYGLLTQMAVSPDGTKMLTGGADGNVRLWDIAAGTVTRTFVGHSASVNAVSFSPDGTRLITGAADFTAKLWNASTGAMLQTITDPWGVNSAAFGVDGKSVLTGSDDGTAKLWDATTGVLFRTLGGHAGPVSLAACSPDGTEALTAVTGDAVKLWNTTAGNVVQALGKQATGVTPIFVAFSPDGPRAVTASSSQELTLWDMRTAAVVQTFSGHTNEVVCATLSADGKRLLTGARDKTAKLWDVETGAVLQTFTGHTAVVRWVALVPDGNQAITGSEDNSVRLWDTATGAALQTLTGHTAAVSSASISTDGKRVISGSNDSTVKLWDSSTASMLRVFAGHTKGVRAVQFSPDGTRVLSGASDYTAKLWETETGSLLGTLVNQASVNAVAFSPDGTQLLTGEGELGFVFVPPSSFQMAINDPTARLWDAMTSTVLKRFSLPDQVNAVAFNPDGTEILTGTGSVYSFMKPPKCMLELWDTVSGAAVQTFSAQTDTVTAAAFSPDGTKILTGRVAKAVLWDVGTGAALYQFTGHRLGVNSVAFHPDGTRVLTGSDDSTAKLWDVASGTALRTFTGHTGQVKSVAFSRDGTKVLTGSDDGTARLWPIE